MTKIVIMAVLLQAWSSVTLGSNVLKVSTGKTSAGATGKFSIVMRNDVSINGLNFVLRYNPEIVVPTQVTPLGRAATMTGPGGNFYAGNMMSFLVYDRDGNRVSPDSGGIFEVEYVVNASITDSTSTEITFVEGMAADSNLAAVSFEYVNGSIQISPSVGVSDTTSAIPRSYQLCQNYPNPFNPSTTIRFDLPKTAHVTLKVYNILGQETLRVLDEKREAGTHNVRVDGSHLASGVYLYRLVADGFTQTKKMLLIK